MCLGNGRSRVDGGGVSGSPCDFGRLLDWIHGTARHWIRFVAVVSSAAGGGLSASSDAILELLRITRRNSPAHLRVLSRIAADYPPQ